MKIWLASLAVACTGMWMTTAWAATVERELRFDADRFTIRQTAQGTVVSVREAVPEYAAGRPDLPMIGERFDLPAGTRATSVEIVELETASLGHHPRVAPAVRFEHAAPALRRTEADAAVYGRAGFQPERLADIGYQGSMRGIGQAWVRIRPVRWDPVSGALERVTRMRVRLHLEDAEMPGMVQRERIVSEWEDGAAGEAFGRSAPITRVSPGAGRTTQPFKPTQLPSVLGSPVAYVIVTPQALVASFQPLADWKTRSGLPAVVRSLETIRQQYPFGVDDSDRIRQFIRDAYARWGTKYVLLGGDTEIMPERLARTEFYLGENIASDLYFSCLDGNWNADGDSLFGEAGDPEIGAPSDSADLLPEVWVGRAPVVSTDDVEQFIDKTFQYTRTPVGDYERRILFFAEVLFPPEWDDPEEDDTILDGAELVEECLPYVEDNVNATYERMYQNYTDARWLPGSVLETRQAVLDSLDHGHNVWVHVGHGFRNVMSVGDNNLTNADALSLTNGLRYANLYASNCTSNAIDFPCIGEAFMHAPNGGAVTSIGSTRFDFPYAGRAFQREYFRLVYDDSVSGIGEAQARQKIPFVAFSDIDNANRWTQLTLLLLGDPELSIWTGTPRTLAVTHPGSIAIDDTAFSVTVLVGGQPVENARVTAYRANDEYTIATTNGSGVAALDFRPDDVGTFSLVVTAYDCVPYEAEVTISPTASPLLVTEAPVIDDDDMGGTSGNGNGVLEAGEIVDLRIPVRNRGGQAFGVGGTLSTTDPMVTISSPAVSYGLIAGGAVSNGTTWYRLSTPFSLEDQHEIPLKLDLIDFSGGHFKETLQLVVKAPEPRHYSHTVVEVVGNTNGRPEPGETVNYIVKLRNLGTGTANGVIATLSSLDAFSSVTDGSASFGTLAPGAEVAGDAFTFSLTNASAKLELEVSDQYGPLYTQTIDVGYPVTPTALNAVGTSSFATLSWLHNSEIDLIGYNIYRSTLPGGPYTKVNTVPTDSTSYFQDVGLVPLTTYYYRVTAVDGSGNESSQSASIPVVTNPPYHGAFPATMGMNTPASVAVARMYQPNKMDIAAGADVLYVWHSDGTPPIDADGEGSTFGDFTTQGVYYAAGPSIGSLNNTGMHIVATTWTSKKVYAFDSAGQVLPGWPFSLPAESWSSATLADLDGDGTKEVLFADNSTNVYILRHNGTEWMDGDSNPITQGVFKNIGSGANFGTVAVGDVDNDGVPNIVFGGSNGRLYVWRPDGSSLPGFPVIIGGTTSGSVAIGPLDGPGDNQLEIVMTTSGTGKDSLYVFKSNGTRQPGYPKHLITSGTSKQPSPALADINVDDYLDVVVASTNGQIYVYNGNNGSLNPNFVNAKYSSATAFASESSPVVADISGDGVPDIIMGDENAELAALSGATGLMLPGFRIKLEAEIRGTPAVCDCDGDGMTEIVVAGWDTKLHVWDYDFPFSPAGEPAWPQFHHDAMRTGSALATALVDVPGEITPGLSARVELAPPSPNPAAVGTTIEWSVPASRAGEDFEISVFDLTGRRVRQLSAGVARAGRGITSWNLRADSGDAVESGVYFLRLSLGGTHLARKMVVVH